jgi:hypothetical protein
MQFARWIEKFLSKKSVSMPETLSDCFDALNRFDGGSIAREALVIDESDMAMFHFGLGMWIRNNWGLWEHKGELYKWFCGLGVTHPDDMSGIILTSYWRSLHQKPIELGQQIYKIQKYWSNNGTRN